MIKIRSINQEDCYSIACLHLNYLSTNFSGKAGSNILAIYYSAMIDKKGAVCYVAENSEKEIVGFIGGVWNKQYLRQRMLRKSIVPLIVLGMIQVYKKPEFFLSLFDRILKYRTIEALESKGYELRPIVVKKNIQCSGIGKQLIQCLLQDAMIRGYKKVHLFTENDNFAARKLYYKTGFSEISKIQIGNNYYIYCDIMVVN